MDDENNEVSEKAIQRLWEEFDTTKFLYAIDLLDKARGLICDPERLRDDILKLHGIACHLINDAPITEDPSTNMLELAEDISCEISEAVDNLKEIQEILNIFVRIGTSDEDEDPWDDEEEDYE